MRATLLAVFAAAQVAVLGGELVESAYPLWIGEPVTLALEPVDPRSLFRGNYAALAYDVGSLDAALFTDPASSFTSGDRVYVRLERAGEVYRAAAVGHAPPTGDGGSTLRGRVEYASDERLQVSYGIEAFFASRERAEALERDVRRLGRDGGDDDVRAIATVMVAGNGRAALRDVTVAGAEP